MKTFYSISEYPGKTGLFYYTEFFKKYNIAAKYIPLGCKIEDFEKTLLSIKNTASGISISMPYKHLVLNYLTEKSLDVTLYSSCNTILLESNCATGYNTDIAGVIASTLDIKYDKKILILGNGCIGRMFYKYLKSLGYNRIQLISRNLNNYEQRHNSCDVFINCTSYGTVNSDSPIDSLHSDTEFVIDLAVKKGKLYEQTLKKGIAYFSGQEFYKNQFKKQFLIYTGLDISLEEIDSVVLHNA